MDGGGAGPLAPDQFEHREPVVLANDCLAIDQAGLHRQFADGQGDEREAVGEVLNVMQPTGSARRLFRRGRQTRLDRADAATRRTFTQQGHGAFLGVTLLRVESRRWPAS